MCDTYVGVESYRHSQGQIWWQLILTIKQMAIQQIHQSNQPTGWSQHNLCTMCQVHCRFQSTSIICRNLVCTRDHINNFYGYHRLGIDFHFAALYSATIAAIGKRCRHLTNNTIKVWTVSSWECNYYLWQWWDTNISTAYPRLTDASQEWWSCNDDQKVLMEWTPYCSQKYEQFYSGKAPAAFLASSVIKFRITGGVNIFLSLQCAIKPTNNHMLQQTSPPFLKSHY